ncbi:rhodanese-like domain-containing protein [Arthrobacter rhizosphaerae]|uniref:rhodanese-like domain-containing protein n=1 Tax=Arthrobacter rhizosphaerae TaxID=2855490 RepID=UPI001FF34628|nr:rhodanese-like domain-containing protein [Arthrobacter rhizosphaerae]
MRSVARSRVPDIEQKRAEYLGITGDEALDASGKPTEMTREELLEQARAGTITVLDVRPPEEYGAAHIPGAMSIPLDELPTRLGELPADREIIAYCRGAYCVLAYEAVDLLHSTGHPARRLNDGMLEWRLHGLPVEAGHAA